MKSLIGLFYYISFFSAYESVFAFHTSIFPTLTRKSPCLHSHLSHNEFDPSQRDEVTSLIISLSEETSDEVRRKKLCSLLSEKLNQEDSVKAAEFAHLWDKIVIEMGSKVQEDARTKAQELDASRGEDKHTNSTPEVASNQDGSAGVKSAEELKLWIMIDMMIQSKQIIKSAMEGKL